MSQRAPLPLITQAMLPLGVWKNSNLAEADGASTASAAPATAMVRATRFMLATLSDPLPLRPLARDRNP